MHEEQSLTLHTSQKNMCITGMYNEEVLGTVHLASLLSLQRIYLWTKNPRELGGKIVNVRADEWWGRTAGVGMLQSFVCMTGNGSEQVLICAGFMCSNLQWGGGEWLSGHYCKQRNMLERLSLWCCSGFCKSSNGACACLSSGVPH